MRAETETLLLEKYQAAREDGTLEKYRGKKGNILVVSPHPDDDVLGAGGTMAAAAARGVGVFSACVTDGHGSPRKEAISDDEMAGRREKEALAALRAVGAAGVFFLRKRSAALEGEGGTQTTRELAGILALLAPAEIYLPAPYERHATHQRCTRLTVEAVRASGLMPGFFGYSLWGWFRGEKKRVVRDITPFIDKKLKAVRAHASQLAYKSYAEGIQGKNTCEAVFWDSHGVQRERFVETFIDMGALLEKRELTLMEFVQKDMEDFFQAYLGK